MRERVAKLLYKASWEAKGRLLSPPRVETLHRRPVGAGVEMVRVCKEPAYLEPDWGYVITERGALLEESMTPNFSDGKASWRLSLPDPGVISTALKREPERFVHYPKVVSLRHWWEWNYYHFYMDVLGKLQLLAEVGIDPRTPLYVGRYVRQVRFAEEIVRTGGLADREWIIPDLDNRLIVKADEVVFCQTYQTYRCRMEHLLGEMGAPAADPGSTDRVFLIRKPPATRTITNWDEVEPVVRRNGFEVVDTTGMTVGQQMDLFSRIRYLVAVHGAGITNVIYRRGAPLGLLELHARVYPGPGDMERICKEFGYFHDALGGDSEGGLPQQANFRIDPAELEASLARLLREG